MLLMSKNRMNINSPPEALIKALRRILRPLVKMLISFQVTYPFLSELLKSLYVEVAEEDFKLPDKKQTDTRISMLTGVHRKDTKRLRQLDNPEDKIPTSVSVGAQILAVWLSDKQYLDEDGHPVALPFKKSDKPNFEDLVLSVCKQDIRARVVLDEWLRLGIAVLDENDHVTLLNEAFIASKGIDEKAFYLGMNVSDHLAAASHNLTNDSQPFMERCVYYEGLTQSSVDELNQIAQKQGMELLKGINARALAMTKEDASNPDADKRMNLGLYFYSEPQISDSLEQSSSRSANKDAE